MAKSSPHSGLSAKQTISVYYNTARRHRTDFLLAGLHPLANVLMGVGIPFFAGKVLASLSQTHLNQRAYLIGLATVTILALIANRFGFRHMMRLQARSMADLNSTVFERLLQRSVGYHVNRVSGKLISDALDFVQAFSMLVQASVMNGLSFILVIIIGLCVVFINSWILGLYLLGVVLILMVWTAYESRKRAALRHKRLVATKNLTAHLSDTIVNAQTVKTFARENHENTKNRQLNSTLKNLRLRDWQRAGRSGNNRMTTLLVLQFCMFVLITHLVREDPAILATAIFAFTYTMTFSFRLLELNALSMQIDEAILNASPMTRMLLEEPEIQDASNAKALTVKDGAIAVDNVTFTYKDAKKSDTVFSGLRLDIKPGEKIGLVGPSGGGKSTFTRLLLRFDDLTGGSISIDGQNIADVTQASLRRNIAYVPQEPLLFHRSIRENIAYSHADASQEQIIAAAKQAQADKFIQQLPQGYDTIVGERGVKLSGGQRQRIAIARAILKDAPILVLDEATSALDSESEVAIQKALWKLMDNRTAIVVAHRLSTIQRMDRIVVLDGGKIVEIGSHRTLLKNKKLYAQLWSHQTGGFLED